MAVPAAIAPARPSRIVPHISALSRAVSKAVSKTVSKAVAPHKAALRNLADIPLTVVGTGCIDFAAFHVAHGWGWLATGLSLVLLEHMIADER